MTTAGQAERIEPVLSCRESRLLLRVLPLRKNVYEMGPEEAAGIRHYLYCKLCRDVGLTDILDKDLTCQEALLVWAEAAEALWLTCAPAHGISTEMLIESFAVEHVWGKYKLRNSGTDQGWDFEDACCERPCQSLHTYWLGIPMSTSAGDGPEGVINLMPCLIEIFDREEWPFDELLAIQAARVVKVLGDLRRRKVTVSSAHYHSVGQLTDEISAHIAALHKLANRAFSIS